MQEFPASSLIRRLNSLFRRVGNFPEKSNQFSSLRGPWGSKNARFAIIPCIFPGYQGIQQRRVRSRLPAPPNISSSQTDTPRGPAACVCSFGVLASGISHLGRRDLFDVCFRRRHLVDAPVAARFVTALYRIVCGVTSVGPRPARMTHRLKAVFMPSMWSEANLAPRNSHP